MDHSPPMQVQTLGPRKRVIQHQHSSAEERPVSPPPSGSLTGAQGTAGFQNVPRDFRFVHNVRVAAALVPAMAIVASNAGFYARIAMLIGYVATFALDEAQFAREHALISVWFTVLFTGLLLWFAFIPAIRISPWNLLLAHNMTQVLFLTGLWGALQLPWIWRESPTIARLMERLLLGILPIPVSVLFCWTLAEYMGSKYAAFASSPLLTIMYYLVSIPLPRSESPLFTTVTVLGSIERMSHTLLVCFLPALLFMSSSRYQLASPFSVFTSISLACTPLLLIHSLPLEQWRKMCKLPSSLILFGAVLCFISGLLALWNSPVGFLGETISKRSMAALLCSLLGFSPLADACGTRFALFVCSLFLFIVMFPPSHIYLVGLPSLLAVSSYLALVGAKMFRVVKEEKARHALQAESPKSGPSHSPLWSSSTSVSLTSTPAEARMYWVFVLFLGMLVFDSSIGSLELVGFVLSFSATYAANEAASGWRSGEGSLHTEALITAVQIISGFFTVLAESAVTNRIGMKGVRLRALAIVCSIFLLLLASFLYSGMAQVLLLRYDQGRQRELRKRQSAANKASSNGGKSISRDHSVNKIMVPQSALFVSEFVWFFAIIEWVLHRSDAGKRDAGGNPVASEDIRQRWLTQANVTKVAVVVGYGNLCLGVGEAHETVVMATLLALISCIPIIKIGVPTLHMRLVAGIGFPLSVIVKDGKMANEYLPWALVPLCLSLCFEASPSTASQRGGRLTTEEHHALPRKQRQELNWSLAAICSTPLLVDATWWIFKTSSLEDKFFYSNATSLTTARSTTVMRLGLAVLASVGTTIALLDIMPDVVFPTLILASFTPFVTLELFRSMHHGFPLACMVLMTTMCSAVYCLPSSTKRIREFSCAAGLVMVLFSIGMTPGHLEENTKTAMKEMDFLVTINLWIALCVMARTGWARVLKYRSLQFFNDAFAEETIANIAAAWYWIHSYLGLSLMLVPIPYRPFLALLLPGPSVIKRTAGLLGVHLTLWYTALIDNSRFQRTGVLPPDHENLWSAQFLLINVELLVSEIMLAKPTVRLSLMPALFAMVLFTHSTDIQWICMYTFGFATWSIVDDRLHLALSVRKWLTDAFPILVSTTETGSSTVISSDAPEASVPASANTSVAQRNKFKL